MFLRTNGLKLVYLKQSKVKSDDSLETNFLEFQMLFSVDVGSPKSLFWKS